MNFSNNTLRCCVRPTIGQALIADALQECNGALGIAKTSLDHLSVFFDAKFAVVVSEIEFI